MPHDHRSSVLLTWLLGDHLGSTTITANADGTLASGQTYTAWGETRGGTLPTDRQYTGQISESQLGIYFYNARYYDPYISQFTQPDTIIPNPYNTLDWNRYAYARYNPINNVDPSGHFTDEAIQNYLKSNYGDGWKDVWKEWLNDKAWMDTLHGAQAGDILSSVWFDSSGNAQIRNSIIAGLSDQELYGLFDPNGAGSLNLNTIYESSAGLGVLRRNDKGFSVIGQVGNIGIKTHTTDIYETIGGTILIYGGMGAIGMLYPPLGWPMVGLGAASSVYQGASPTAYMGLNQGDYNIVIQTFYATGVDGLITEGYYTTWVYQFRDTANGTYQTVDKGVKEIYNPHRNY